MSVQAPYRGEPPRVAGSDTSEATGDSMIEAAPILRQQALEMIERAGGEGVTCEQVELAMGQSHQSVSARIRELVLMGKVVDSGARRANRSGRTARVYMAWDNSEVAE